MIRYPQVMLGFELCIFNVNLFSNLTRSELSCCCWCFRFVEVEMECSTHYRYVVDGCSNCSRAVIVYWNLNHVGKGTTSKPQDCQNSQIRKGLDGCCLRSRQ